MNLVALGMDAGSTTAKVVGIDAAGELVWHVLEPAEPNMAAQASRLVAAAGAGIPVIATGYGRKLVREASRVITEISCHGAGVARALGHGGTVIDIGGQDSKVIVVDDSGAVGSFGMNDRCAAGTGRFLEVVSRRLGLDLPGFSAVALAAGEERSISSTCTVFAESEIISLLAEGTPVPPITRGLFRALAKRIAALARGVGVRPPVMLSGGVARSDAMRAMLAEELGIEVTVPPNPQLMGAYGAALLGLGGRRRRAPTEVPTAATVCSE